MEKKAYPSYATDGAVLAADRPSRPGIEILLRPSPD
jgi:hypothetical protein